MPYCIYLRKSRADDEMEQNGAGETLARHRDILSRLAAKNNHAIGYIYQEIVSGETVADRPQVQALLADVSAGKWQGVYVMEVERLARGDTMDQGLIAHAFKCASTYIITPAKTYDPSDPSDEEYFEFSLFMSRREYKTITRRMQGGRVQSAKEGKYIGSRPPYGYRKVKLDGDKGYTLAIHDEEAAVVRQVFDWYLHGMDGQASGIARISARLGDLHIPTGEQGSVWKPCRIHRMLTNPAYIGLIQWGKNKTERTVTPTGISKKRVMQSSGQLYKGLHPAVLSEDVFHAVQAKLHEPRAHVPVRCNAALSNPLAGLLVCSDCGHLMSGLPASGRQPAKVFCRTRGCACVQAYREPIEKDIREALTRWLEDVGVEAVPPARSHRHEYQIAVQSLTRVQSEREKLLKQISKLHDLVEQEVYTPDEYSERHRILQERIRVLAHDESAIRTMLTQAPADTAYEGLQPTILRLLEHYDNANAAERNAMLKSCISKVVYTKHERGVVVHGMVHSSPNQFELDVFPLITPDRHMCVADHPASE